MMIFDKQTRKTRTGLRKLYKSAEHKKNHEYMHSQIHKNWLEVLQNIAYSLTNVTLSFAFNFSSKRELKFIL